MRRVAMLVQWMAITIAPVVAYAQDTTTTPPAPPAASDTAKPWNATVTVGLVNLSGNSSLTTLNGSEAFWWRPRPWTVKQVFVAIYGKTNDSVTTSLWSANVRGDRITTGRVGIYILASFDRNTFAGVSRRFQESAGALWRAWQAPHDSLNVEVGLGLVQEQSVLGVNANHPIARVAGDYRHTFTSHAWFGEVLEVIPDLEVGTKLRINSTSTIVAILSRHFAMKVGYIVQFNDSPLAPATHTTDRYLTTGLQAAF